MRLLDRLRGRDGNPRNTDCECGTEFRPAPGGTDHAALVVDAGTCPGGGDIAADPDCRARVVDALADRDADDVRVRVDGRERAYDDATVALLLAAGRFVSRVEPHDARLAERGRRDPLAAARTATGRAGPVSDVAARTGLAACAEAVPDYGAVDAAVAPAVANARLTAGPPPDATLLDRRELDTGAVVRRYRTPDGGRYVLEPLGTRLDDAGLAAVADAHARLAAVDDESGASRGDASIPDVVEAARESAGGTAPREAVTRVLRKHTRGHGILEDLFADPLVSEVRVTAPVTDTPVRAVVDGDRLATNVHLTPRGAATLASQFRRKSGRAFSRASPTLDATTEGARDRRVRVAGVTDPASDGYGFVFRLHDADAWTLPALVSNGTLPPSAAALCSLATDRAAAGLIAGPRGAGKTTLLAALLWELPPSVRVVVVEDTQELPVDALRAADRDVQGVRIETDGGPALSATDALRTALRLGEGALVVGEVRGEEATTLYEAMRVGAASSAVLGTIHGDGADAVFERVVADLGVSASSFAATDFLVTLAAGTDRRVVSVEEVRRTADGVAFEPLFENGPDGARPTGVIERGNSRLVASLARPDESYADLLSALDERESLLSTLADTERIGPEAVDAAHRDRTSEQR